MRRQSLFFVLVVALPAGTAPRLKPNPVEPDILGGKWLTEQVMGSGADLTRINKDLTYEFTKDGRWFVRCRDEDPPGGYVTHPATDPVAIDLYADGPSKEKMHKGICRIEGDRLILCFGGKERPAQFPTGPLPQSVQKGQDYFVMRRVVEQEK